MTTRKSRNELTFPPQPKSVPYPPEAIWGTKEDGATMTFRGNTFVRRGNRISRVFDPVIPNDAPAAASKP